MPLLHEPWWRTISPGTRLTYTNSPALKFRLVQLHYGIFGILTVGHGNEPISLGAVVGPVDRNRNAYHWTEFVELAVQTVFCGTCKYNAAMRD